MKNALVFDIGGTKIAAAIIREDGQILEKLKTDTYTESGAESFINSVISAGKQIITKYSVDCIGISSAGPLDPVQGQLIDPTNLKTNQKNWGKVDVVTPIRTAFQLPTVLENDAASAVIGELWKGNHGEIQSLVSMTLGTGVGVGAIIEGQLQRCRRGFHPEISHIPLNWEDSSAPCGCGNFGCIEAFLGGSYFPKYLAHKKGTSWKTGLEIIESAKRSDSTAIEAMNFYGKLLAHALQSIVLIYSPEVVVFSGGFSHGFDFFKNSAQLKLKELLKHRRVGLDFLPDIKVSKIADEAGLYGAAKMAFNFPVRL